MHGMDSTYGLWSLVILNSAIFIIFAFSFAKPQTKTDWRSFGAFSAFGFCPQRGTCFIKRSAKEKWQ